MFRTCRTLGISTVAIHSDADAGLPYVREADVAVRLPGNTPAETYLDVAAVLAAAKAAGADAIHPGYGFLSENADFARAVIGAGLTWVGPTPGVDRRDGLQDRGQAADAGGRRPGARRPRRRRPTADLPLLVKASAGGGGRGMRIVRDLADLDRRDRDGARPRPRRRSATAPSSSSRTSSAAATSRCRSSAPTASGRRAGLLAAAPPPEGGRGGAGTRPAATTVRAGAPRRRAHGGRGDRLPRRRHRRVPLRPGHRAVLVPGDEHPAPGRAPGHRAGARRRPGRAAARRRRGPRVSTGR